MNNGSIFNILTALAKLIEYSHPNSAYVLNALAGSIMCGDADELRGVVQQWVSKKLKVPEVAGQISKGKP